MKNISKLNNENKYDGLIVSNVKVYDKMSPTTIKFNIKKYSPLRKGTVIYDVLDKEIIDCSGYDEVENEDVYQDIHDWVTDNIKLKTQIYENRNKIE